MQAPTHESGLTIAILSFNHPQITAKCVAGVLRANAGRWPVSLTHNGSRSENVELLQEQFPRIEHHIIAENRGYAAGANALLAHAFQKHEWVFFVTNDCELLTTPVVPPNPGLYAPTLYRRKLDKIDSLGGLFTPHKRKLEHIRELEHAQNILAAMAKRRRSRFFSQYFYVPGTAFYIDRATFTKLKGFDESLHTYWEDVDFSVRARHQHITLGLVPETQLIHKVGKTCHKDPFYTNNLFQRNRRTISRRHTHPLLRPFIR